MIDWRDYSSDRLPRSKMVSSAPVPPAKIGLDARLTFYTRGGIAHYIRRLAESLPGLDPGNQYFVLHSRRAPDPLPLPANAHRVECWTPAHHRLERAFLGLELLPHRFRLLHSPDFIPPHGRFRSVITVHDLTFLHYPQFLTAESRRYYNGQIRAAVDRADFILTDSDATRTDLLNLLGVPPAKAITVYLAADPRFSPQPAERVAVLADRYGLPQSYVLFVGTFEPRKNVAGLLSAYAQLSPSAPPLVLAGNTGWLFDDAHRRVQDLGLSGRVKFLADLPGEELPALYSGAAAFCLPSYYEGFGLPLLEALACGVPAVVADRASLPEIAGGAAALCNPDDPASIAQALEKVLGDTDYRRSLVHRGHDRVKQFTWDKCARETLAVYKKALGDA